MLLIRGGVDFVLGGDFVVEVVFVEVVFVGDFFLVFEGLVSLYGI